MSDWIRNILKFAFVILILIILIIILARLANKDTTKKEPLNSGIQTIEKSETKVEDTIINNQKEETTSTVVDTPDTATSSKGIYILGLFILSLGFYSVVRTQKDS